MARWLSPRLASPTPCLALALSLALALTLALTHCVCIASRQIRHRAPLKQLLLTAPLLLSLLPCTPPWQTPLQTGLCFPDWPPKYGCRPSHAVLLTPPIACCPLGTAEVMRAGDGAQLESARVQLEELRQLYEERIGAAKVSHQCEMDVASAELQRLQAGTGAATHALGRSSPLPAPLHVLALVFTYLPQFTLCACAFRRSSTGSQPLRKRSDGASRRLLHGRRRS